MVRRRRSYLGLGWWCCAAAAALFGAATPATKRLVGDAGPLTLAGLLYVGAALAVLPFQPRRHAEQPGTSQRGLLLLTVVVGGGVAPVLLLLGLHHATSGTVSLLLNLELVATAIIARSFLHEQIGRRAWLGIALVLTGGAIVTGLGGARIALGAVFVVGACACWGVDNAISASLDRYAPATITLWKGLVAGSVNLALGLSLERLPRPSTAVAALAIGSLGYGLSITLWVAGARRIGAARGQVMFAMGPFVGAALAVPLVGEQLRPSVGVAFAVSLAGVVIVATARHQHVHVHEELQHSHPFDPTDPHHCATAIEIVDGPAHRHLVLAHEHAHLPDIHHRHHH